MEPAALAVRVRGARDEVAGLGAADILLWVELFRMPAGGNAVPVRFRLPEGVSLAEGFSLPKVKVTVRE